MSTKEPKMLMHRFFEEMNKGKAAVMVIIDELYVPDVVFHSSHDVDIHSLKDLKQYNSEFFDAVLDAHLIINDMISEGDKVATCWTMTGTHTGTFRSISPTHKKVTIKAIIIDHIANGKFVEELEMSDTLGTM